MLGARTRFMEQTMCRQRHRSVTGRSCGFAQKSVFVAEPPREDRGLEEGLSRLDFWVLTDAGAMLQSFRWHS